MSKRKIFLLILGIFIIGILAALVFRLASSEQECSHLFQKSTCSSVNDTEHETVTVCRTCGETIKTDKRDHEFEYAVCNLTTEEKVNNPRAISRESIACTSCGRYVLDNAIYEHMTFDSSFDAHSNLTAASLPAVADGKYTVSSGFFLSDALKLAGRSSLLEEYSITFDIAVNLDPATVDYHPLDGSGAKKPPIFFALIDGGNKWDYKNCALGLNRDAQSESGAYELLLYSHNWARLPSVTHSTGFFMELGKEYSVKMDFCLDVSNSTYQVTLYAREIDATDYIDCGTVNIVYYYDNGSYIYFEGAGNVLDNFKILAPFVK